MDKPNLSHFEIKFDIKTSDDNPIDLITSISGAVSEALKGSILKGCTTVIPTVTVIKSQVPLFSCYDCEWHTDKCKRNDCSQYDKFIEDIEFCEIYGQLDNSRKISVFIKGDPLS